jgi:phosphoglycerate dehydrogenase-like enzyme
MRLAILDDYQGLAERLVDWNQAKGVTVVAFRDHVADADALVARLSDFDAVMRIRERTEFPASVLDRLPRLKLILATGMRNNRSLDLAACDRRGITVSTTDALHQTTVEITWAMILGLFRRIPQESASLRAGGWQMGLGQGLAGKTLGVLGLGNMGQPVAVIGKAFGMSVVAWSPNLTPERTAPFGVACVSKRELFERSDAITVHIPLSDHTVGLVGPEEIAAMKPQGYIVNTSRPQIVEERALIAALAENRIGGAGLDVFETEPLPAEHPFRVLPNVIATPHIGFVTEENYRIFYEESLENLLAYRAGEPIRTITAAQPFRPDSQVAKQMHKAG